MTQILNPYGKFLGDRDPVEVMTATPGRLREYSSLTAGPKATHSYAPGKWTAAQILAHLADCEVAFAFRLKQAAADDHHIIQPFDQDAWARVSGQPDAAQALATFSAVRAWNLAFLQQLPAGTMDKVVSHPERGPMTFGSIVALIGGHDLNHLGQLDQIASQ